MSRPTDICKAIYPHFVEGGIIIETTDSGERGMNPVALSVIKECLLSWRFEPATSCSQVFHATDQASHARLVRKGENTDNLHFFPFPPCFFPDYRFYPWRSIEFVLSVVNLTFYLICQFWALSIQQQIKI